MQSAITLLAKSARLFFRSIDSVFDKIVTYLRFYSDNVKFADFTTRGIPYVMVARGGSCSIGKGLMINNGLKGNPIGRPQPCVFVVDNNAALTIGNNVGLSSVAIVAHVNISIGNNVKIGGGVCIYDTDFHSLDATVRAGADDTKAKINAPVIIHDDVFIGAHSTILKGVTIGSNAIVGACSVVTKNVPAGEIWGGNPAKFIRSIYSSTTNAESTG